MNNKIVDADLIKFEPYTCDKTVIQFSEFNYAGIREQSTNNFSGKSAVLVQADAGEFAGL